MGSFPGRTPGDGVDMGQAPRFLHRPADPLRETIGRIGKESMDSGQKIAAMGAKLDGMDKNIKTLLDHALKK